jgi:hypothetical protein
MWMFGALAVFALACGKGGEEGAAATGGAVVDSAARQAEWQWLEATKRTLDQKREELASLRDQAASGAAVGPQIDAINQDIAKLGDEHGRRLVEYINADPPVAGEPVKPEQLAAIRMKSAEDILIAKEHIELGGDYRKAIDIYAASLLLDPDNPDLKAALADAQARRYMTAERFAAVKKGMGEAEVVRALGRPLARNIRDYPEKKVSAWYYTKNESGEAAGVFFNEKKVVYSVDFNAVKQTEKTAD